MTINKIIKAALAVATFSFTFLLLAETSPAQGRYVGRYSRADVDGIIRRLEDSGDEFRRDFISAVNRSNLSGSQKSRYRDQANDFENQTDRLRSNFDRNNSWWESRAQVQNVIANARPLNVTMNAVNFRRDIERQWNRLRDDVNRLADTYDLPGIAGGGWTGGGNWPGGGGIPGGGWGGQAINPPNWALGTFFGSAPGGVQITLTISGNGSVTAIINGQMFYGAFTRGNNLLLNGATSRVTRQGDGIRTVRTDTGERINYSRSAGTSATWNPGNQVPPPGWARGTFNGMAPNGSRISLTIAPTGAVTANINGQYSYGSYTAGNMIYMNGAYYRVGSISRGIQVIRMDNNETINYRRQ